MKGPIRDRKGYILQSHSPATSHGRGIFKPRRVGERAFPHIPNAIYPGLTTTSLSTLPNTSDHPTQMAYFNDNNNTGFYSAPDASGGFESYPFLGQASATEEFSNHHTYPPFSDRWSMGRQPGPMIGSATNLRATANSGACHCNLFTGRRLMRESPESVASPTPYATPDSDYGQPPYPGQYWLGAGQQTQCHHPGVSNWDVPTPSSGERHTYFKTLRNLILTDVNSAARLLGSQPGRTLC